MSTLGVMVVGLALVIPTATNAAEQECARMAFGKYCLGGAAEKLPPEGEAVDGIVVWFDDEADTIATLFKGRVVSVARDYKTQTMLKFGELGAGLTRAFGRTFDRDKSSFPSYADTPEDRETAIAVGKGQYQLMWDFPGYMVVLEFTQSGLAVKYLHTALTMELVKSRPPQF